MYYQIAIWYTRLRLFLVGTGGVTWFIPPTKASIIEYKDVLARALGGRYCRKLRLFGTERVTTGAGKRPSKSRGPRDMVINQGMGRKLRNQVFMLRMV